MKNNYLNIYNNLINLTRNKKLYLNLEKEDTFSDRLTFLFLHLALFIKRFKSSHSPKELQKLFDFIMRQIELSIREIGYGDASVNKKMKNYLNLFHSIISEVHFWDNYSNDEKKKKISIFLENHDKNDYLVVYFNKFKEDLSKKNLNYFIKSVSNP